MYVLCTYLLCVSLLQKVHTRNGNLQALDRSNRDKIQVLYILKMLVIHMYMHTYIRTCILCICIYVHIIYIVQELEDTVVSLQRKHAVEWSFTMREHERDIAELITYDDMESVTKQLDEECVKKIEVCVQ